MTRFKLSYYTGPTAVVATAQLFREAGIDVTVEGTEHIHLTMAGADPLGAKLALWDALAAAHPAIAWGSVPARTGLIGEVL